MDINEALKVLAMSEQERYQNGIENTDEALKKVKSELDFWQRSFEGVKNQCMKQYHEIEKLKDQNHKLWKKPQQYDKELMARYNKLLTEKNALEMWYEDGFEEVKYYVGDFNNAYRKFVDFMESRKSKDGD